MRVKVSLSDVRLILRKTSSQQTASPTDCSISTRIDDFFRLFIDSMRPRVEVQEAADIIDAKVVRTMVGVTVNPVANNAFCTI